MKTRTRDLNVALKYLEDWKLFKHEGEGKWKFNKNVQNFLVGLIYDKKSLGKENFALLLLYLEGMHGGLKQRLLEQAQGIIEYHNNPQDEDDAQVDNSEGKIPASPGNDDEQENGSLKIGAKDKDPSTHQDSNDDSKQADGAAEKSTVTGLQRLAGAPSTSSKVIYSRAVKVARALS
uniref:WKF domain-containing protein n=1 Tax=Fibrocapsa japonica TaxID=94617 RepID=A0A7S2XZX8_9STRA